MVKKILSDLFKGIQMPNVNEPNFGKNPPMCGHEIWDAEPLVGKISGDFANQLITIKDLEMRLDKIFSAFRGMEKPVPIFIIGPPGVGKTELVLELGRKNNLTVHTYIASTMDPTQVMGLPYPVHPRGEQRTGTTVWYPDQTFVVGNQGEGHVYFFDELNMAPPATQAAFYRLILEGRLGNIDISRALRIGAGNRTQDYENVQRMGLPLATRFQIYLLRADIDSWLDWASENDINDFILYYLYQVSVQMKAKGNMNDARWFCINPEVPGFARATPRSWTRLSRLMDIGLDGKEDVLGALGSVPGTLFHEWYVIAKRMVTEKGKATYRKGMEYEGSSSY